MEHHADEVLLESSPLHSYLQELGIDSGNNVTLSSNGHGTTALSSHNSSEHNIPQSQLCPKSVDYFYQTAHKLLSEIVLSDSLLEEHHIDLLGLIDAFAIEVLPPSPNIHPTWFLQMALNLPRWLTNMIPYVSTWLEQHADLAKLSGWLRTVHENVFLWKKSYAYCQDLALLSRGAILIDKSTGINKVTHGCIKLQQVMLKTLIRELEHLKLCSLSLSHIPLSEQILNLVQITDFVIDSESYAESGFALNQLKITFNSVFVMRSLIIQRLGFIILSNDLKHFQEALQTVSKHLQAWDELNDLFKFQRNRLVSQAYDYGCESVHQKRSSKEPQSSLQITLHSLFLHSRELFMVTNDMEEENIKLDDEVLDQLGLAVENCRLCLDTIQKTRKPRQDANQISASKPIEHKAEEADVAKCSSVDQPITDEVYTAVGAQSDIVTTDPADFADEDVQLRNLHYKQYMMRELKRVISSLSKETEVREERCLQLKARMSPQGDYDGDEPIVLTANQLAELTKNLIEGRDIRSLVSGANEKIAPHVGDSSSDSAEEVLMPRSKCTVYTAEADSDASCDSPDSRCDEKRNAMRDLASLVASRVSSRDTPLKEDCYLDDQDLSTHE